MYVLSFGVCRAENIPSQSSINPTSNAVGSPQSQIPSPGASVITSTSTDSQTLINLLCNSPPTCLFIRMELCKAETLRDWLAKCNKENTRKKKDVLGYFEQVSNVMWILVCIIIHI